MHVRKGETVIVIAGNDKGKTGTDDKRRLKNMKHQQDGIQIMISTATATSNSTTSNLTTNDNDRRY